MQVVAISPILFSYSLQERVQRLKQAQILRSLAQKSDFTIAAKEVVCHDQGTFFCFRVLLVCQRQQTLSCSLSSTKQCTCVEK